jgi:hypothetical protein
MNAWASRFFGVVTRPQTWLNVAYLWLAFPLGLFYFVFLTVGLSLGLGLVVIWVGLPILLVVVGAWWLFGAFERAQATYLLGVEVAPSPRSWELYDTVWGRLKGHFVSGATWRDLLYLFAKLPLGIACFALSMTALATTTWLLAMPAFWYLDVPVVNTWVPPLWAALLGVPAGILACFLWLHVLNAWAWVCGQWARLVFGAAPRPPAAPGSVAPGVPASPVSSWMTAASPDGTASSPGMNDREVWRERDEN